MPPADAAPSPATDPEPMTVPDRIRQWFIDHPGDSIRPTALAAAIGAPGHHVAVQLRRLLDTGEVSRYRPGKARSGPGVVYTATAPYIPAESIEEWTAIRVARQKESSQP